ncbi:MAG: hypothetical protein ACLVBP_13605 [Ruminococcus sp.]
MNVESDGEEAPKLIVCGTGPMEDWCKTFVRKNSVNIELQGLVSNEEARKTITNSKSSYNGNTVVRRFSVEVLWKHLRLEHLLFVLILEMRESIVEEGITGYKFECKSIESIILAVEKMREKPLDREKIKELYEMKYSENANYKILNDIYVNISN